MNQLIMQRIKPSPANKKPIQYRSCSVEYPINPTAGSHFHPGKPSPPPFPTKLWANLSIEQPCGNSTSCESSLKFLAEQNWPTSVRKSEMRQNRESLPKSKRLQYSELDPAAHSRRFCTLPSIMQAANRENQITSPEYLSNYKRRGGGR